MLIRSPRTILAAAAVVAVLAVAAESPLVRASRAAAPIVYTLSFPEPQQRWMRVEIEFPAVTGTLPLRMSRSSPGRYTLHEFAKNVYDVATLDGEGRWAAVRRTAPHAWEARGDGGPVRVRYRIFGDRVDGTYLAVDETHAHINAPASLMWAEGRELDPVVVRIEPPADRRWRVATQLFPTDDPFEFTAPNLHYLIDSPIEVSAHSRHTFVAESPSSSGSPAPPTIAVALHDAGVGGDAEGYLEALGRIVREQAAVFGEYPRFDRQTYTFIADYLPWAVGDGMEHRNSTILTHGGSIATDSSTLLATAAHEFFHTWNVERIRPRALEPFNLLDFNVTGELWLAEGFTSYYETLTMVRSGAIGLDEALRIFGDRISQVLTSPALQYRSADEMSRMALLWDRAAHSDRTNLDHTFLSYYVHGAALGMGFDLTLRERTGGARSLDDFMHAMWKAHGQASSPVPGLVASPYVLDDVRRQLAAVAKDQSLADELIGRFVLGREVMDYERLAALAGLRLRQAAPGRGSLGRVTLEAAAGRLRIAAPVPPGSPAAAAGLAQDDLILAAGGRVVRQPADLERVAAAHRPGEELVLRVQRRTEQRPRQVSVTLEEQGGYELVTIESAGGELDEARRAFREQWVSSRFR